MAQSSIIRVSKPERYTTLSNDTLRDKRLTFAARGLLTYLLSLPDNWEVRVSHLIEQSPAGRDAVYSMLKELTSFGYVARTEKRDAAGRIVGYETIVRETPAATLKTEENQAEIAEIPDTGKPDTAEPLTGEPPPKKDLLEEVPNGKERPKKTPPVAVVFSHWQKVLNHPNAKLTEERRRAINARLGEGYTVDDLMTAIDGCARSAFHLGENDTGQRYDDLTLICRNGSKLESFIALKGRKGNGRARTQAEMNAGGGDFVH
jgi:hypothetical protein